MKAREIKRLCGLPGTEVGDSGKWVSVYLYQHQVDLMDAISNRSDLNKSQIVQQWSEMEADHPRVERWVRRHRGRLLDQYEAALKQQKKGKKLQ